jgi:hypothetical protein
MFEPSNLARDQAALAAHIMADPPGEGAASTGLLRPLRNEAPVLGVYQTAWRVRLVEALRSNYPVLHQVLGDDDFAGLCAAYVRVHPPHTPSIRWFGAKLSAFLETAPAQIPHPALVDLARMEWALGSSFDSADHAPIDFSTLAALAPEAWPDQRFRAHPSVSLLRLDWAIEPLWQTLTHHPEQDSEAPEPSPHHLLAWRLGLESRWRSVEEGEVLLLKAAFAGAPFSALCEAAALQGEPETAPMHMARTLRAWVDAGLLCAA